MESKIPCAGCGRYELHKLCPAWGTPYYMTGNFPKELELQLGEEYTKMREAAFKRAKDQPCPLD